MRDKASYRDSSHLRIRTNLKESLYIKVYNLQVTVLITYSVHSQNDIVEKLFLIIRYFSYWKRSFWLIEIEKKVLCLPFDFTKNGTFLFECTYAYVSQNHRKRIDMP